MPRAARRRKFDGVAAVGAADRDGDVLLRRVAGLGVPKPQDVQPEAEILATIAPGWAFMLADAKIDAAAGARQLVGDLGARGSGADHQHGARRRLVGVAVGGRAHLHDVGVRRYQRRDDAALEWSGGGHDIGGLDRTDGGFGVEAGAVRLAVQRGHGDAAADGGGDLGGVGGEIVRHLVARGEAVGVNAGDEEVGEAIVPGGAVGVQRVPAFRAPAFSDAVAFQYDVRPAALAELGTHHQAGLAAADDQGFDFIHWHGAILFRVGKTDARGRGGTSGFAPRDYSLRNGRTVFGQLQREWDGSDQRPSRSFQGTSPSLECRRSPQ